LPDTNSSLLMLRVDTTRSPTLIQAVLLKRTPLGLMRNTLPLAFSAPCIFDISLLTTRLRTADVADGCSKVTLLSTPMENPCQSITMFCDVWFMVMSASVWFMEPLPAVMSPPVGRVEAEKAMEEKVRKKKW